jgi:hypothetical protein
MDPLFSDRDVRLIEALEHQPELEPAFDDIKACLVWDDERPSDLTPNGYETLCDLWIIRSYIHRGVPPEEWGVDPTSGYFQGVWQRAQTQRIRWPGFQRMTLSQNDREYFERCLRELEEM